jgi:hypothetical protein
MAFLTSATTIDGPIGPVFDLVTSARFWAEWHPATQAVYGVTQRPYRLGDVIHERVKFGGLELVVSWRVAEHEVPRRVLLQSLSSTALIIYTFEDRGSSVAYRRDLDYDSALLRAAIPSVGDWDALMQAQSDEGVARLKALVERILADERAVPPAAARG